MVFLLLVNLKYSNSLVSYTAEGHWVNATEADCQNFRCSPATHLTWRSANPHFVIYNSSSGCKALIAKGIKTIFFHGDSYMRQVYAAVLITLNGDYKYGSIVNGEAHPTCAYRTQFLEKRCGLKELNHHGLVCNGSVLLNPVLTGMSLSTCHNNNGTISLWSFGNHQLAKGRVGVNNSTLYQQHFAPTCRDIIESAKLGQIDTDVSYKKPCSIWWLSTHFRNIGWFGDEAEHLIYNYNKEMRQFFDEGRCGPVNYIDVYNMTFGIKNLSDARQLSYDQVHWGMEVNLIKAQIVLNALLSP